MCDLVQAHRVVQRMTEEAFARCDKMGIAHCDFYHAMKHEQAHPSRPNKGRREGVADLFEDTFRRLAELSN